MLIKKDVKKNKPVYPKIIFVVFLILLISIVSILLFQRKTSNKTVSEKSTSINDAKGVVSNNPKDGPQNYANKDTPNDGSVIDTRKPDEIPVSKTLSLNLNDFKQANGIVYSSVSINGATASGRCVFEFTSKDSKPVTQEVVSTNTQCVSNIPEVRFDKLGDWNLRITFYSQSTKTEVSQNVTIK